ncbi:MAG TPA: MarR family transcriptional regulator [Longimicrobium sp.]|nr:MarR family transcriptional regulator [Longimicrobium sp.]
MTETPPPPSAAPSQAAGLRRVLRELTRLHALRDRVRVGAWGLTPSGAHAMEVLAERGALSLNALAGELFVDKSTACRIVGLLEDRGHVARRADPRDGRAIQVELTPGGRALEARLRLEAVGEAEAALAGLAPGERDGALAFLRHLARVSAGEGGGTDRPGDQEEDE